jgi:hypothetical protein
MTSWRQDPLVPPSGLYVHDALNGVLVFRRENRELVLSESLFGAEADSLYDACELPDALLPSLRHRYARVDLPDHPLWAKADDSPVRWYAAPGRLVRRDGIEDRSWIHARGRTAADLETIRAELPGPWVG